MAYVSDSNLTQFWGLAKDYINAEDGRFANWQKTEKAGAVTCWPVGGTQLLPTVDFLFTETPPASGDKGPENPSTITGVTQAKVTRCGKNIITPFTVQTNTTNGITFTADLNAGTITANGTATASAFYAWGGDQTNLPKDVTMTLSGCPSGGSASTYLFRFGDGTEDRGSGVTFTIDNKSQYFAIKIFSGVTVSNLVFRPQLELGSTATSFEAYDGTDYTIDLGGTYYGGSIDLATGLMTVTWGKYVFSNANITWQTGDAYRNSTSAGFYIGESHLRNAGIFIDPVINSIACNKFEVVTVSNYTSTNQSIFKPVSGSLMLRINNSFLSSYGYTYGTSTGSEAIVAFKAWLIDNPVELVYNLATPYTIQLTPPQIRALAQPDKYVPRLNTVYTDASAVQVGYAKSPVRSEYELTQAIIATEGGE